MKKYILGLALLVLFLGGRVEASEDGPYIVYTLETLNAGDVGEFKEVPGSLYLYPHIFSDNFGSDPNMTLGQILDRLRSLKPKLYKGTDLMEPELKDYSFQLVTVMTAVKTEKDFKTLMSEVIYTFDSSAFVNADVSVAFHFKNTKLEKKYGGKIFAKKDVPYAAFILTSPLK